MSIDIYGNKVVDECRACGAQYARAHSKHGYMCDTCGKLYSRYLKARTNGDKDMYTAGKQLKARGMNIDIMEAAAMNTSRICKQCGRNLPIDNYRKYVSRSTGKYDTSVGNHTVCIQCENFNQRINAIYRKEERTPEQEAQLAKAKEVYVALQQRGLEPKGRYAADILGIRVQAAKTDSIDDYFNAIIGTSDDSLMDEYNQLLTLELTDEPDVYDDMLSDLRERSNLPNGKVKPEYRDIYLAVAERIDEYNDNYWD